MEDIKKGKNVDQLLINYSYKHAELIANGSNRWDNVFINYE